jgi:hypothetical protein
MRRIFEVVLFVLLSIVSLSGFTGQNQQTPCITARIYGQLGNNLFQVATASALAWEHHAEPCFPDFNSNCPIYRHVFFRCSNQKPCKNIALGWGEPAYSYCPIQYYPDMQIDGYFQSEKYFSRYRKQLLELFAPHPDDLAYIRKKYSLLLNHPQTVGVQIRYYKWEFPTEDLYPQYGKEYLEAAMAKFPETSLFVVSSNNVEFARKSVPSWAKNVVFLENEPNYIDMYVLSYCKHNIITNSSFGWWSAWLNQNPEKIVVRPAKWISGLPTQDVCPEEWVTIDAHYE